MSDKAIEAAARAIARRNYPSGSDRDIDMMWEGWTLDAQAAIAAYLAQSEADGAVMAPVEADEAMIAAAMPHTGYAGDAMARQAAVDIYRAMLAARPKGEG